MKNLNTTLLSFNSLVSRSGLDARVLNTGPIDFTKDTTYNIDLTATVQSAKLAHPLQAVYIDASGVHFGNTMLQVNSSGQRIVVSPGAQGYYPLLIASGSFQFTIVNQSSLQQPADSATLYLHFVNVPMVACEWQTTGGSGVNGAMVLPVRIVTTASDTASTSDATILCDASTVGGPISESLPPNLTGFQTCILTIVKKDTGSWPVIINGNGQLIAGSPNGSAITLALPYQAVTLQWTGSIWEVIGSHPGNYITQSSAQANFDMRYFTVGSVGVWWRHFVDSNTGGINQGIVCGWYDVNHARLAGGFDDAGYFNALVGLNVKTPANITFGTGWQSWTPTVAPTGSMTVSGVTISAATYLQIGPLCYIDASLGFTTGGTLSNACYVALPMAYKGTATQYVPISTWGTTGVPSNVSAIGVLNPGSTLFTIFAGTDTVTNYSAGAHSMYLHLSYRCQ